MLFNWLDAALGTTAKVQTLRALMPLAASLTGREVRRVSGVRSVRGQSQALTELVELGILIRKGSSSTHLYRVNREHGLALVLLELFEAEAQRISELGRHLAGVVNEQGVASVVRCIVLFGSNARGDARPHSDTDLLVIVNDEASVDRVRTALLLADDGVRARFGLRISPYVLAWERAGERWRDGDPLIQNVLSEGRTLLGTPFDEVAAEW